VIEAPLFHFGAIHIDCPWLFENWSEKGEAKNPNQHYDCMTLDDVRQLPVGHWARNDCLLVHWVTGPLLDVAIDVMKHWGFRYVTIGFIWPKKTRRGKQHFGTGYYTRQGGEIALFGAIGSPKILDHGVSQILTGPVREHSRKPEDTYSSIERLVDGPFLDVFGRANRPGWTVIGNQSEKFQPDTTSGAVELP